MICKLHVILCGKGLEPRLFDVALEIVVVLHVQN